MRHGKTRKPIDALHTKGEAKPRTYRERAHRDYLKLVRSRKPGAKKIRKAIGKQLGYLARNLSHINTMLANGKTLHSRQVERLETIRKLYEQQTYMYKNHCHSVPNRIVSLSQPFLRPIVRGKVKAPVEFGAKLDISIVNGWTRFEVLSFDAYNEATKLTEMVERYKRRTGRYPERVLADKIYRNRNNLAYCKERGIHLSGPALGRPRKDELRNKKKEYLDQCERVEVERRYSLAKRKCGLGLITTKLQDTICHSIAMSILVLNLRRIQCAVLRTMFILMGCFLKRGKLAFVQ